MPWQPALILDKSAFEKLSRDEHAQRLFRYRENITPVLLREILTDLTKSDPGLGTSPEKGVQILARKFLGSGGVVNADCRKLCAAALTGAGSFEADGRPVIDDYKTFQEADGSYAITIDLMDGNRDILRWAQAEFAEREHRAAAGFRKTAATYSVEALRGRLRQHHVLIPRPKNIADIVVIADDLLSRAALQQAFLDWVMEQSAFPQSMRDAVWHRWESEGRPMLGEFAPHAHHCTRTLLLLLIGMTHNVLSARPTNRIDIEYLFYSPFCEVFVSDDRLHRQLAPLVLSQKQTFVTASDFKTEMKNLADERKARRLEQSAEDRSDS